MLMEAGLRGVLLGVLLCVLVRIDGAGSEGTCTAWNRAGRQSWFFIPLLSGWKTELVSHPAADSDLPTPGLGVRDRPAPPAPCAPCFHSSPSPGGTRRDSRVARPGRAVLDRAQGHGDAGTQGHEDTRTQPPHACSGGRRGAGGSRAAPVAWQLPCRSILPENLFSITDAPSFSRPSSCTRLPRASKVTGQTWPENPPRSAGTAQHLQSLGEGSIARLLLLHVCASTF